MNAFKITFSDGNTITTDFNGGLEDAQDYYKNFTLISEDDTTGTETFTTAIKCEQI